MMDIMSPKIIQSNFLLINRAVTFCKKDFLSIFRWCFKGRWKRLSPNEMTFVKEGGVGEASPVCVWVCASAFACEGFNW